MYMYKSTESGALESEGPRFESYFCLFWQCDLGEVVHFSESQFPHLENGDLFHKSWLATYCLPDPAVLAACDKMENPIDTGHSWSNGEADNHHADDDNVWPQHWLKSTGWQDGGNRMGQGWGGVMSTCIGCQGRLLWRGDIWAKIRRWAIVPNSQGMCKN